MARPLKYDEQFTSLVTSVVKEPFLLCISMKVQSTAFNKSLSLQNSIRICSVYDILFSLSILYLTHLKLSLMEIILVASGIIFFIISLNMSSNLNKEYALYYYFWRSIVLFIIPLREFFNYSNSKICYYTSMCSTLMFYILITIGLTIIHFYLTKISWSFLKRLQMGQALLVIHGKYLEKMLNNENNKLNSNGYIPPNQIELKNLNSQI